MINKGLRRKRRLRKIRRWALIGLLLSMVGGIGAAYWWYRGVTKDLPEDLSSIRDFRPPTACTIFSADGTVIDRFYLEKRVWVAIDELPDVVWQAFVAAEDRRFFHHHGVDPTAIARAIRQNLRGSKQGGSTITQQLVKNLLVGNEQTYTRKVREATLAIRLEKTLSKREILELYLNFIYLGGGNYGVEAAAQDYFGISARDLDAGQAAQLAGIVPNPNRSSPRNNPTAAERRRRTVLRSMLEVGYLDRNAYSHFRNAPPPLRTTSPGPQTVGAAYATQTRRELRRLFGNARPDTEGYRVHTALDLAVQEAAEEALRDALRDHLDRQGPRASVEHIAEEGRKSFLDRAPMIRRDERTGELGKPGPGQCFRALVPDDGDLAALRAGPWTFTLQPADKDRLVGPPGATAPLHKVVTPGDVLQVCAQPGGKVTLSRRPWAEGAVVVIDNRTEDVVALVGGYQDRVEGFVRATQSMRQPGSSFKPYIYAAALAHGHNQLDRVSNGPLSIGGWKPTNYDNKYGGMVSLRNALARSLNLPAVRMTLEVGPAEVRRTARALGVTAPLHDDVTIALGSAEVTPMDQARGFAALARGGRTVDPVYIRSIETADGKPIAEAGGEMTVADHTVALAPRPATTTIDPAVAYQVADMMRETFRSGTARKANVPGRDRAGKTGTTNDYVDAWFIGFTPTHTVAVWIGTDGTGSLGDKETGATVALPVWKRVIDAIGATAEQRIAIPDDAILINVDDVWMAFGRGRVPKSAL